MHKLLLMSSFVFMARVGLAADAPKLPVVTKYDASIVDVKTVTHGARPDVSVVVTLDRAVPNCGADFNFTANNVVVQDSLHANNITTVEKAGKQERVLRVLGENETTIQMNWSPVIRGYSPEDLKGVKIHFNAYHYHLKVTGVEQLAEESPYIPFYEREIAKAQVSIEKTKKLLQAPALTEKEKAELQAKIKKLTTHLAELKTALAKLQATKFYRLTFDHAFPTGKSQLVTEISGKPAYLSLLGLAPSYASTVRAEWTPGADFQIPNPSDLLNKDVGICAFDSYWNSFGFGSGYGQ